MNNQSAWAPVTLWCFQNINLFIWAVWHVSFWFNRRCEFEAGLQYLFIRPMTDGCGEVEVLGKHLLLLLLFLVIQGAQETLKL